MPPRRFEVELPGQLGTRPDPDADDHQVRGDPAAIGQLDGLHPVVLAAERNHLGANADIHTAADVRVAVELGYHRRNRTADQAVGGLDDGHRLTLRARDRRGLKADEPATDHHHRLGVGLQCPQHRRIVGGAQVRHAVEVGAGHGQPARARADGQRQPVEVEHVAAGRPGRPGRTPVVQLDRLDPLAGDKRDVLPGKEFRRAQATTARAPRCRADRPSTAEAVGTAHAAPHRSG